MKTIQKLLTAVSVIAACYEAPVWARALLESAVPGKDAQLASAPKEVALHFNESIEPNFSSIKVFDAWGKSVLTKNAIVDERDLKTLRVPLHIPKPGQYTVQWVGVGHDGHPRAGDYKFSVK